MKKMVLVPETLVDSLRRKDEITSTPELDALVRLGKEMDELRARTDLDIVQKSQRYQEALRQYLYFLGEFREQSKPQTPITNQQTISQPTESEFREKSLVQLLPRTAQEKGQKLIDYIGDQLAWDPTTKEAIISGKKLEGSNLMDLVYDTVVYKKKERPKGWEEFSKFLDIKRVPQHLRTSRQRRVKEKVPSQTGGKVKLKISKAPNWLPL